MSRIVKPTLRERLAYAFDSSLAGGPIVLIGWLALVSVALIVVLTTIVWVSGIAPSNEAGAKPSFIELAWMGLMRTLDSGTMGGDVGSWPFLLSMLAVTLGGIFVISTFIGTLTSAIEAKLDELRKGRSRVLESGHTLVLGWSPRVFTIVQELVAANESLRHATIVVMSENDKVEMEDALRERVADTKSTKIICRSGSPSDMADLDMANVQGSKSIVILPSVEEGADRNTIKTLLAITNSPNRRPEPYHIVTEIRDPKNLDVAKLVGRDEVELLLVADLLARITVQTCRQSGLSVVYQDLLDFGGDEIYFKDEPALVGRSFGEILDVYEECAVLGLRLADGSVRIKPPFASKLAPGDQIIAIAEDDDKVVPRKGQAPQSDLAALVPARIQAPRPEHTLILGWNAKAPLIVRELDAYVATGSQVRIVADFPLGLEAARNACPQTKNVRLALFEGDPSDRNVLEKLEVGVFDHVVLLSPEGLEEQDADAHTLISLLHLRDMREKAEADGTPLSIVSEMLDVRNRALAEVTRADDFIVGDQLVSLLMTQISENKNLNAVFADLFDPEGAEIYLKPAADYVKLGQEVSITTLVEAARRRDEVLIGYRLKRFSQDRDRAYGVTTNPAKSSKVTFGDGDALIVLAES